MKITIELDSNDTDDAAMIGTIFGSSEVLAAAPAPKAETKPRAAAKPEPEPEDLLGGDGPTKADATTRASELIAAGNGAAVKAALTSVGVKRVSELGDDDIVGFLAALEDA